MVSSQLSVEGPERLLRLYLTLQGTSQPDDQKLTESDADGNASHRVEVVVDQSLQHDTSIKSQLRSVAVGSPQWSLYNPWC